MRSVFVRRGAAILALLAIFAVSPAFAAQISPPIGVTTQAEIRPPIGQADDPLPLFDLFFIWLQAVIRPPIG
jgi:hypothetical protein